MLKDWPSNGLAQDCSISIANALAFLQSCTTPFIWHDDDHLWGCTFKNEKMVQYDSNLSYIHWNYLPNKYRHAAVISIHFQCQYINIHYCKKWSSQQYFFYICVCIFLAATKQLYKWYFPSVRLSVCPSVCLSVCHTFLTMFPSSYHHEIFRSYYQWPK